MEEQLVARTLGSMLKLGAAAGALHVLHDTVVTSNTVWDLAAALGIAEPRDVSLPPRGFNAVDAAVDAADRFWYWFAYSPLPQWSPIQRRYKGNDRNTAQEVREHADDFVDDDRPLANAVRERLKRGGN